MRGNTTFVEKNSQFKEPLQERLHGNKFSNIIFIFFSYLLPQSPIFCTANYTEMEPNDIGYPGQSPRSENRVFKGGWGEQVLFNAIAFKGHQQREDSF